MDLIFRENGGYLNRQSLITEKIGGGRTTLFTRKKGW